MITLRSIKHCKRRNNFYNNNRSIKMQSEICKFYNGKKVFITGGSGFVGSVLIEKLLRSTNVSKIYMLLRPKKNKNIETRTEEIFNSPLFQKLKNENPNFRNRVIPVNGDCSIDDLGLSVKYRQELRENVNIVFHSAASVRFNENLKHSFDINARGTKAALTMAKQIKNLKSVVYVSTAYSHCYRDTIDETFYDCPQKYEEIETKLKDLSLEEADKLAPKFIGKWPNTYTFAKALAESYVKNNSGTVPTAIFRPSIVISTYREPLEGWTNSFSGAVGVYALTYLGIVRVYQGNSKYVADLVPVDKCVSALIATAWDIHQPRKEKNIPIYNYVSYPQNPLTWSEYVKLNAPYTMKYPSNSLIWTPCEIFLIKNYYLTLLSKFFVSYLPGIVIDTAAVLSGQKPGLLKMYRKTDERTGVFNYFTTKEWKFKNENVIALWNKMNEIDKELFPFSLSTFKWTEYFENFVKGIRIYLLKEPLDNLDSAKIKLKRFLLIRKLLFSIMVIMISFVTCLFNIGKF